MQCATRPACSVILLTVGLWGVWGDDNVRCTFAAGFAAGSVVCVCCGLVKRKGVGCSEKNMP